MVYADLMELSSTDPPTKRSRKSHLEVYKRIKESRQKAVCKHWKHDSNDYLSYFWGTAPTTSQVNGNHPVHLQSQISAKLQEVREFWSSPGSRSVCSVLPFGTICFQRTQGIPLNNVGLWLPIGIQTPMVAHTVLSTPGQHVGMRYNGRQMVLEGHDGGIARCQVTYPLY